MATINWCKKQAQGIRLQKPDRELAEEYLKSAEESMHVLKAILPTGSRIWIATLNYYIRYFGFYSFLISVGIRCEIHECTIAVAKLLVEEGMIKKHLWKQLEQGKNLRIQNQYFLRNKMVHTDMEDLSDHLLEIGELVEKSNELQERVKSLINYSKLWSLTLARFSLHFET